MVTVFKWIYPSHTKLFHHLKIASCNSSHQQAKGENHMTYQMQRKHEKSNINLRIKFSKLGIEENFLYLVKEHLLKKCIDSIILNDEKLKLPPLSIRNKEGCHFLHHFFPNIVLEVLDHEIKQKEERYRLGRKK